MTMTNRTYFSLYCTKEDLPVVVRYSQREMSARCDYHSPIWVKEEIFEKWLDEPFDQRKWDSAKNPRSES